MQTFGTITPDAPDCGWKISNATKLACDKMRKFVNPELVDA